VGGLNHLTEEEAADAPDVVIGEFLVCGTSALVLFDTGATGSYITSRFVNKLSLPTTTRSIPIITSSPLGDIRCTLLCKGVDVVIQDHKFFWDLTVLPSNGIDVIQGWIGSQLTRVLLTQNVHLAPSTQQAEQDGFTRAKNHETCQSIFS
jgi:hypothetical protein